MAWLSGRSDYRDARIPIRVERLSGVVAALTTTNWDGSWEVQVEPGDYVVVERYVTSYRVTASGATDPSQNAASTSDEFPPGSPGDSRRARARREGASS